MYKRTNKLTNKHTNKETNKQTLIISNPTFNTASWECGSIVRISRHRYRMRRQGPGPGRGRGCAVWRQYHFFEFWEAQSDFLRVRQAFQNSMILVKWFIQCCYDDRSVVVVVVVIVIGGGVVLKYKENSLYKQ